MDRPTMDQKNNGKKHSKRAEHLRVAGYMWKPGERKAGRAKGTQNKFTRLIKEAVAMAADNAGDFLHSHQKCQSMGLTGYLEWMSLQHPAVFAALIRMIYPTQHTVRAEDNRTEPYRSLEDARQALLRKGIPLSLIEDRPRILYKPLPDDDSDLIDVN